MAKIVIILIVIVENQMQMHTHCYLAKSSNIVLRYHVITNVIDKLSVKHRWWIIFKYAKKHIQSGHQVYEVLKHIVFDMAVCSMKCFSDSPARVGCFEDLCVSNPLQCGNQSEGKVALMKHIVEKQFLCLVFKVFPLADWPLLIGFNGWKPNLTSFHLPLSLV